MANEVKIKITSDADTRGFKEANAELDKTKIKAKETDEKIKDLGDSVKKTGGNFTESDRKISTLGDTMRKLDRDIAHSKDSLKMLSAALADTDDAAQRIDIQKAMSRVQRDLSASVKAHKALKLSDMIDTKDSNLGQKLGQLFSNATSQIKAIPIGPAIAAGVVAASPLIGAAISGAIIGGATMGGIIGGAMLAAKDARVQAAGKVFGENLLSGLQSDASPMIKPLLGLIGDAEDAFGRLRSTTQSIFKNSAQYLRPMGDAVLSLTESVLRGVDTMISKAGPVMSSFEEGIRSTGHELEGFFDHIAGGSEGASLAIGDIFGSLNRTIGVLGPVIEGLTKIYEVGSKLGITDMLGGPIGQLIAMKEVLEPVYMASVRVKGGQEAAAAAFLASSDAAATAAQNMEDLQQRQEDLAVSANDLYGAQTNAAQSIRDASKVIKDNGKTLSLNTEKGLENREALSKLAGTLKTTYDKMKDVNGLSPETVKFGDTARAAFVKTAHAAGLSSGAAEDLADEILGIPRAHDTKITAQTSKAKAELYAIRNQIAQLHGKTITITTNEVHNSYRIVHDNADSLKYAHGGIKGAARGMVAGGLTWVGEQGPELVNLPTGSTVRSAGDSQRMMRQAMGNGGGGQPATLRVLADRSLDNSLIGTLFAMLRWEISLQGGNVQTVLGT